MAETSTIEWTDATWTPIRARCVEIQNDGGGRERVGWHCEHVSPGCANCYAESINRRLGTGFAFKPGNLRGKRGTFSGRPDRPEMFLDEKMLMAPLRWKRPRMIFVCSMTDLFADFVPDEWIDRVFAVMALAPHHTFQVLTKRSARMQAYMSRSAGRIADTIIGLRRERGDAGMALVPLAHVRPGGAWWPLPNVWLGVSAEDQRRANERVPDLLMTPAAVRFVSAEPLLEPLDLTDLDDGLRDGLRLEIDALSGLVSDGHDIINGCLGAHDPHLDWVIVGGESGPGARPMRPDWVRRIRDDCAEAGVAFHFKQHGEWIGIPDLRRLPGGGGPGFGVFDHCRHDMDHEAVRVGKKRAGRLLDGRTHDDVPNSHTGGTS